MSTFYLQLISILGESLLILHKDIYVHFIIYNLYYCTMYITCINVYTLYTFYYLQH